MHAHMIATLISMVDHIFTSKLSYVRLPDGANFTSARRRRMLMIVTLRHSTRVSQAYFSEPKVPRGYGSIVRKRWSWCSVELAYKVPTMNMRATASFFFQCMRRDLSWESGKARIQRSRTIEMMALAQPRALILIHRPSC